MGISVISEMRISSRARYALRMMLDLVRNGGEVRPVSLAAVSERTDLSRGYLEQVAQSLRKARLLKGISGRYGGYRLVVPASEITVGQVLEASIGPMSVVDCLDDPSGCPRYEFCECRVVYGLINSRIGEILDEFTLADLLDPRWVESHGGRGMKERLAVDHPDGFGCSWRPKHERQEDAH